MAATSIRLALFLLVFLLTKKVSSQSLVIQAEAESGTLTGVYTSTAGGGYSGSSYVTGFDNGADQLSIQVSIPVKKYYQLVIRYNAPFGYKEQQLYINGTYSSNLIFQDVNVFTDLTIGSILLNAGTNTISIRNSWGYIDIDRIAIYTIAPIQYQNVVSSPIDPSATQATKDLYSYLKSNYGKVILSGQTSDYYDNVSAIANGLKPVVRAFDFQNYSPMNPWGWNNGPAWGAWDDGTTDAAIAWYNSTNKKGVVSFQWHWFSPSGGTIRSSTFYTGNTTFDVSRAVVPGNPEYTEVIRDIDAIAVQLKKLSDANVPVLWRPLHEAGGAWFWWGAKGPAACLALYDIMYNRLTNYHQLHNLIWVWSTPEPNWYPGNSKVDIIGYDSYPGAYDYSTQKLIFDQLYAIVGGTKMIAMTENGPIPNIDDCFTYDAIWSFFMSWSNLVSDQNSTAHIQSTFSHTKVIVLDEVTLRAEFIYLFLNTNENNWELKWKCMVYDEGTFTIEYSLDGIHFSEAHTLEAHKNISDYMYSKNGTPEFSYIRIRYNAFNESPSYSSIIAMDSIVSNCHISTPSSGIVLIHSSTIEPKSISIYSVEGKLMEQKILQGTAEIHHSLLGMYIIEIENEAPKKVWLY